MTTNPFTSATEMLAPVDGHVATPYTYFLTTMGRHRMTEGMQMIVPDGTIFEIRTLSPFGGLWLIGAVLIGGVN